MFGTPWLHRHSRWPSKTSSMCVVWMFLAVLCHTNHTTQHLMRLRCIALSFSSFLEILHECQTAAAKKPWPAPWWLWALNAEGFHGSSFAWPVAVELEQWAVLLPSPEGESMLHALLRPGSNGSLNFGSWWNKSHPTGDKRYSSRNLNRYTDILCDQWWDVLCTNLVT